MSKLRSPLQEPLYVTQTYHTGSNNTAVDLSAVADSPVYAVADGKITYRSSGHGSYCIQQLDNSDLKVYYVHTYKWVPANTQVKKGQIICYIAPTSLNGGNPTHLHIGLQTGKYFMDYLDRNVSIKAGFTWGSKDNLAIRNAWFNGGSTFDWSKHKDLSYANSSFKIGDKIQITGEQNIRKGSGVDYEITGFTKVGQVYTIEGGPRVADNYTWYDLVGADWVADVGRFKIYTAPPPEPTPEPPTCEEENLELEKRIVTLQKENEALRIELGDLGQRNIVLEGLVKAKDLEIAELKAELESLRSELAQTKSELHEMNLKYNALVETHNRIMREKNEAIAKLKEGQQSFIDSIKDWIGEILAKILNR
jgi:hypothetical protein